MTYDIKILYHHIGKNMPCYFVVGNMYNQIKSERLCRYIFPCISMSKIEFTVIVSVSIAVRDSTRRYFERSRRIRAHFCVRESRESRALGWAPFCFSTAGSRDAFGSRFDHIKRQMSFYGGHCHPGGPRAGRVRVRYLMPELS